jgi:hypothetical protein
VVSSHYGYREEEVMDHTPEWLNRKFDQAMREKWEDSQNRVWEGFKSLALLVDVAFNKGKSMDQLMPGSYEEALKRNQVRIQQEQNFIQGQWWEG